MTAATGTPAVSTTVPAGPRGSGATKPFDRVIVKLQSRKVSSKVQSFLLEVKFELQGIKPPLVHQEFFLLFDFRRDSPAKASALNYAP